MYVVGLRKTHSPIFPDEYLDVFIEVDQILEFKRAELRTGIIDHHYLYIDSRDCVLFFEDEVAIITVNK